MARGEPWGVARSEPWGVARSDPWGVARGDPWGVARGEPWAVAGWGAALAGALAGSGGPGTMTASRLGPFGRLLDLAMPPQCAGCGTEGAAICRDCLPEVGSRIQLPAGAPLGLADGPPDPLLQLEWCSPFSGTTRKALHALKYAGERRLAAPLGGVVAERWRRVGVGGDVLVPVPVHEGRRRERGYDQAALIAAAAAGRLGLPWHTALTRTRATTAQYHLDRRHRAANVAAAFHVIPSLESAIWGRWVVLVDDVVTTGATLSESARALLDAGAAAVSAITVARER